MIRAAIALLALLATTCLCAADATVETVRRWGLLGRWAVDCSPAPGPDSPTPVSYEIKEGRLVYINGYATSDVVDATANPDGSLTLTVHFLRPKDDIRTLVLQKSGETIRPMLNRNALNEYTIRDGAFVANGMETASLKKCGGQAGKPANKPGLIGAEPDWRRMDRAC
jgi:hypothetical protein